MNIRRIFFKNSWYLGASQGGVRHQEKIVIQFCNPMAGSVVSNDTGRVLAKPGNAIGRSV